MAIESRTNKDGSTSFRARVKDPVGKWYRSEWRRARDEAMADEASHVGKKRKGTLETTLDQEGGHYTVQQFWDVWSIENRTETSEGWKISQNQMYRSYVQPVIGEKRLSEIGSPDIGKVLNRMKDMGRGAQMRLHVYRLLNQMFDCAVNYYRMIRENPVNPEFHRIKVPKAKVRFLKPEQSWALLEVARLEQEPAVWVELLAGLRTEATVALIWPCLLWDLDLILICRAFKQKVRRIEEYPKGKDAEYVPLMPLLKEYLWGIFQDAQDKTGYVCQGPRGGFLRPETFGPRLKKLCLKAKVPMVSPHELRHSCTELFVQEGASQEDLRRLLNHKSGDTTLRYIHRTDDRLHAIAARIQKPQLQLVSETGTGITHEITHAGNKPRMPLQEVSGNA